jgi:hypothetical protein
MYNNKGIFLTYVCLTLAIALVATFFIYHFRIEQREYKVKVTDKIVTVSNRESKYLIFTETANGDRVFENSDNIFKGKFNSSDVHARIEIGKEYIFVVTGQRAPIFSWYENIIEVK